MLNILIFTSNCVKIFYDWFSAARNRICPNQIACCIEQVDNYKYLGNILTAVQTNKGDIFSLNYDYLSGQSRKAMFRIKNV